MKASSQLPSLLLTLLLIITLTPISPSPLLPQQLKALQSLHIPSSSSSSSHEPCSSLPNSPTTCDSSEPFRHLISLHLSNCSHPISLSYSALKSLSTLHSLSFLNCPFASSPSHFPPTLSSSLLSLTSLNSLHSISPFSLSHLSNLSHLTLSNLRFIPSPRSYLFLSRFTKLSSLTISHSNLTGFLPRHLPSNLTHIDFSSNMLRGSIPSSITLLESLQSLNLSSNAFKGPIPSSIGNLISLKNLSLAYNSFSGSIPDSISAIPGLLHLDLSSNHLNGTIPSFLSEMDSLKHLNLANNNLRGVLPFNSSFVNRLQVLKLDGNSNLCYNQSLLSLKLKLEIAPCDKYGMPVSPPPSKRSSFAHQSNDSDYDHDSDDDDYDDGGSHNTDHHHRPNKLVLGVAIALSSIVFLSVFLILCSKCCR